MRAMRGEIVGVRAKIGKAEFGISQQHHSLAKGKVKQCDER